LSKANPLVRIFGFNEVWVYPVFVGLIYWAGFFSFYIPVLIETPQCLRDSCSTDTT